MQRIRCIPYFISHLTSKAQLSRACLNQARFGGLTGLEGLAGLAGVGAQTFIVPACQPSRGFATNHINQEMPLFIALLLSEHVSTMYRPVVLILGSGSGIGASVTSCFAADGYSIASAARSLSTRRIDEKHLELCADLSEPAAVPTIFQKVQQEFGVPPSVVIYNGAYVLNLSP